MRKQQQQQQRQIVAHGNSLTASKLATARNIAISGAVSGNADFNGSKNINISTSLYNNATTLNFATIGSAKIKRKGNLVTVSVEVQIPKGGAATASNSVALPDWAIPSNNLLTNYALNSTIASSMNGTAFGYIQIYINGTTRNIRLLCNNKDTVNTQSLHITLTYIVD